MPVEERLLAPETAFTPAPPVPARPARLWWSAIPFAAYWGYLLLSDWAELPTFVRFASRFLAGAFLTLFAIVWWWVNRRTSLRDKAFGFGVLVAGGLIAAPLCDPSSGVAGPGIIQGPLPFVLTVWMLGVLLTRRASATVQRAGIVVAVASAWTLLALVRLDGLSGDLRPEFHWRWSPTAEEAFKEERGTALARAEPRSPEPEGHVLVAAPGDWPGFRGPNRDGIVRGTSVRTDWKSHPPELVWRHRVGPAWSSVVIAAGKVFTQEQRDDWESVVCYDAATGEELWEHGDNVRFSEETAGPGPRATPCFADGRVFAVGCTGILNALDAATGRRLWWHDLAAESKAQVPHWGFTGSPLVVGDVVVAFAGGPGTKNLFAYRARSGDLAWSAPAGETSYGSPQPATVAGTRQVLMWSNRGLTAVHPGTGAVLWEHPSPLPPSAPRSVQPTAFGESGVLIASEADLGLALLDLQREGHSRVAPVQRWASRTLKPAFNDFVVSQRFAFGFDGRIFACVDLANGSRRWKEGRYGEGQVVLLADQSLLLVVAENGEVILLRANPERSEELGRFQAVRGKTWNHPAVVNGRLYLRNAEEMACYDLGSGVKP
jgi:outer membrane protein assembly factor BamB